MMRRWVAAVLGVLLTFVLAGCAPEEQGRSLTAVGIDTYSGVVADYFTRWESVIQSGWRVTAGMRRAG